MVINVLQRGAASLDRLNVIFNEKSEIVQNDSPISFSPLKGEIEFKNVSFAYPNSNHDALSQVSFRVTAGKTLAITGRTGSGKSTQDMLKSQTNFINFAGGALYKKY